jgi:hypothetical protein
MTKLRVPMSVLMTKLHNFRLPMSVLMTKLHNFRVPISVLHDQTACALFSCVYERAYETPHIVKSGILISHRPPWLKV